MFASINSQREFWHLSWAAQSEPVLELADQLACAVFSAGLEVGTTQTKGTYVHLP